MKRKHWIRAMILGLIAVAILVAGIILLDDSEKERRRCCSRAVPHL